MDEINLRLSRYRNFRILTPAAIYSGYRVAREVYDDFNTAYEAARAVGGAVRGYLYPDTPGPEVVYPDNSKIKNLNIKSKKKIFIHGNKMANTKYTAKKTRTKYKKRKNVAKPKAKTNKDKAQDKLIATLAKQFKADQAEHTRRRRDVQAVGSQPGEMTQFALTSINTTALENAMSSIRYYNPATNALVTNNVSGNSYTQMIHFKYVHQKITIRNNYQVPAKVTLYSTIPRADTNSNSVTFYVAGLNDQTIGPITSLSPLMYLTDLKIVNDNWSIKKVFTKVLQPGQECYGSWTSKSFDYDPSNVDSHASQYQAKYGAHQFVLRVEGCIAHDTVASEYLTTEARVDTLLDTKYHILYDAGANLNDFSEDDNSSASFTNAGVVSNKPVSDNQSFSVA